MLTETIFNWQIDQMKLNLKTFEFIFQQADANAIRTYRDNDEGWTALEVLGHLADFQGVIHQRAVMTVAQDNPMLPFPNPDELAVTNNYNGQSWQDLLHTFQSKRAEYIDFLKARTVADWERPAQHPTRGTLSFLEQFFLCTTHDVIHIEQIMRILAEKKVRNG